MIQIPTRSKTKYIKYELTYKQKQKLLKLSEKHRIDPENIVLIIESFFDEWSENVNNITWETVLTYLNSKTLKNRINKMSDEIVEIKKKNNVQKKMQIEYEDDYLALIELGRALESLTKIGDKL
ncbi:MAG: hypothetical protein KGD64_14340 [Candidatus Heimdallarchaeota archaeon]|nr:hypothetical protein [Candidatus Heimdallarchaeota archaeon]